MRSFFFLHPRTESRQEPITGDGLLVKMEAVFSAPCYCLAVAMIISSRFLLASKVADELVISRSVKFKKALRFVPGRHSHS